MRRPSPARAARTARVGEDFGSDVESYRFCHSPRMRSRFFAAHAKSLSISSASGFSGKCSTGFATPGLATIA